MTNQSPNSNPTTPTVYARHNKNFETYITQYAEQNKLPMHGSLWEAALVAAKRLDHSKERSAANQTELIAVPPPANFLGRLFRRLLPRREAEQLSEILAIRAFLEQAPQAAAQQSEIEWGPLKDGMGSRMKARLLPGGQQKGSLPTPARFNARLPWKKLYHRKQLDGKTLYVRAHLLHHEAGGPGLDYNTTALTGALQGDFGANHANLVMRYLVEGVILWASGNLCSRNPTITEIHYDVIVEGNRQARKGSKQLGEIVEAYKDAAERLMERSTAIPPTHQEVMTELALTPHFHDAFVAVEAKRSEYWEEVHDRLEKNHQLWELEDQIVPKALHITYFWVKHGNRNGSRNRTIIIDLPNCLTASFKE